MGGGVADFLSDVASVASGGLVNVKKTRFNVPFSSAHMRNFIESLSNVATLEMMENDTRSVYNTDTAKEIGMYAGVVALAVTTYGIGSALSAPAAAGAEGAAAAGAEGAATAGAGTAASATGTTTASSLAAAPATTGAAGGAVPASQATGFYGLPGAAGAAEAGGVAGASGAASAPSLVAPAGGAMGGSLVNTLPATSGAVNPALNAGWFASQHPYVQAAIVGGGSMAAGQMLTGGMGGYFAGASAEEKLELEKKIAAEREAQIQYLNTNNQYAPLLQFRPQPIQPSPGSQTPLLQFTPTPLPTTTPPPVLRTGALPVR